MDPFAMVFGSGRGTTLPRDIYHRRWPRGAGLHLSAQEITITHPQGASGHFAVTPDILLRIFTLPQSGTRNSIALPAGARASLWESPTIMGAGAEMSGAPKRFHLRVSSPKDAGAFFTLERTEIEGILDRAQACL